MGAYSDLQDALYNVVSYMMPDTEVIWMYDGGAEPSNPYIGLYVLTLDQQGREEISTYANETLTDPPSYYVNVKATYEATVQIGFRGSTAGDIAHQFNQRLNNPLVREQVEKNALSIMRQTQIRNAPQLRDTKWVQAFNQDVVFAYAYNSEQLVNTIEQVIIVNETTGDKYFIPETIG